MKFRLLTITIMMMLFLPFIVHAQTSTISGTLQDSRTKAAVSKAVVSINGTALSGTTDVNGVFMIQNVAYGAHTLTITSEGYEAGDSSVIAITVNSPKTEVGVIKMNQSDAAGVAATDIPVVTLNEPSEGGDEGTGSITVLNASRDPYASAAAYTFSNGRFRNRGYYGGNIVFMNGIEMTDLNNGRSGFSTWGGLNDVVRNRDLTFGLNPSSYSYGALDGSSSIDTRASRQRKQFSISYALSNRTYDNRIMATYGTGLLRGGWAFSGSISRRWAEEGYIPGTYYDGWSWYMSLEKRFSTNHSLSLTQLGANTENGRSGAAVQEIYDLSGTNFYNPYWGYQNGKLRNASVSTSQQPLTVLSHQWNIDSRSSLNTSIGYQYGIFSTSGFDWFNAPDPRPDFYRRLPSYIEDSSLAAEATQLWQSSESFRQVDWDHLYEVNQNSFDTIANANGIAGNTVSGLRSRYIIEERVNESQKISFNMVYTNTLTDHYTLTTGFSAKYQKTEYYKRVKDLLGGEFYADLNQFAEQDYPGNTNALQNDLNNPNRILHEGDKFGYDYNGIVNNKTLWVQNQFRYDQVDFFVSVQGNATDFLREGLTRNGIFDSTSFGKSKRQTFETLGVKGGATYKLDGRNSFFANASYEHKAPLFANAYFSPRTRNDVVNDLKEEKIFSIEGGYVLKSPKVKLKATGYYTQFNDGSQLLSYYHEDYRTFVNYSITNIDRRHIGFEFGAEVTLGQGWSASTALSLGQYIYTSRMLGTITQDNKDTILSSNETIYSENYYVGNNGPHSAGTIGIRYRSKKFWSVNLNANYFADNYMGFNPARRTIAGVDNLNDGDPARAAVLDQQKFDGQFTLDFFGNYSWKVNNRFSSLKRNTFLVFSAGITNILNNKDMIVGGYEQLRFDFAEKNPEKFAPKLRYGYGTTYFISIALRIN